MNYIPGPFEQCARDVVAHNGMDKELRSRYVYVHTYHPTPIESSNKPAYILPSSFCTEYLMYVISR